MFSTSATNWVAVNPIIRGLPVVADVVLRWTQPSGRQSIAGGACPLSTGHNTFRWRQPAIVDNRNSTLIPSG